MKKLIFTLAFISVLGVAQVSAQSFVQKLTSNLYYGPKLEANISTFTITDMPGVESKFGAGGSIGGFLGMKMSNHFAVQEDFMFNYKTSQFEEGGVTSDFKYMGAEMAIYAVGSWNAGGRNNILIGVGPFASYGISAKSKLDGAETNLYKKNDDDKATLNRLNAGVGLMVGYEFACGLQINASCKYGLMNMLDADKDISKLHPITIGLGVTYRLGK